jgi:hypothetical protein
LRPVIQRPAQGALLDQRPPQDGAPVALELDELLIVKKVL